MRWRIPNPNQQVARRVRRLRRGPGMRGRQQEQAQAAQGRTDPRRPPAQSRGPRVIKRKTQQDSYPHSDFQTPIPSAGCRCKRSTVTNRITRSPAEPQLPPRRGVQHRYANRKARPQKHGDPAPGNVLAKIHRPQRYGPFAAAPQCVRLAKATVGKTPIAINASINTPLRNPGKAALGVPAHTAFMVPAPALDQAQGHTTQAIKIALVGACAFAQTLERDINWESASSQTLRIRTSIHTRFCTRFRRDLGPIAGHRSHWS